MSEHEIYCKTILQPQRAKEIRELAEEHKRRARILENIANIVEREDVKTAAALCSLVREAEEL